MYYRCIDSSPGGCSTPTNSPINGALSVELSQDDFLSEDSAMVTPLDNTLVGNTSMEVSSMEVSSIEVAPGEGGAMEDSSREESSLADSSSRSVPQSDSSGSFHGFEVSSQPGSSTGQPCLLVEELDQPSPIASRTRRRAKRRKNNVDS